MCKNLSRNKLRSATDNKLQFPLQNLTIFIFVASFVVVTRATFDLTNVDLTQFQYFKYPKATPKPFYFNQNGLVYSIRKRPDQPSKLQDTINKAQATVKYFRDLAFGKPDDRKRSKHVLDPELGSKLSLTYQFKHGQHGERLVELLGSGPSREKLLQSGAIES